MPRDLLRVGTAMAVGVVSTFAWLSPAEGAVVRKAPQTTVSAPMPGERFTLSGTLGASTRRPIRLERFDGARWRVAVRRSTGKLGRYHFTVSQPTANAKWRVVAPRVKRAGRSWAKRVSRPLSVKRVGQAAPLSVPLVTRAATPITLRTTFRPARPGRPVALQAQIDGVWRQVARAVENGSGGAAFTYRPPATNEWGAMRAVALPWHGAPAFVGASRPFAVVTDQPIAFAAHRGASATHPENTLPAIREAIAQGADYLELDVRRTKDPDGTGPEEPSWVLLHDGSLARTTNIESHPTLRTRAADGIRTFTLDEIKQLDAGSWKAPRFACPADAPATHDCRIPTLAEAVDLIATSGYSGRVLFDVKPAGTPEVSQARMLEFYDRVKELQPTWIAADRRDDKAVFMSFEHTAAKRLVDTHGAEGVETAAIINDGTRLLDVKWAAQAHLRHDLWGPGTAPAVDKRGVLAAAGWTVNAATDIARLAGLGADIITTDDVPSARRVLLR